MPCLVPLFQDGLLHMASRDGALRHYRMSDLCFRRRHTRAIMPRVSVRVCVHALAATDLNAESWHRASIHYAPSRGRDAVQVSTMSVARAHAAAVALGGYRFAAPDGVHLSSSPGRRPGLGSGRTRFAATNETGLEVTQQRTSIF